MNSFLSVKEETHVTEEHISTQNINLNDAEYFNTASNNYKENPGENWNILTWKCFYCNHIDSSCEIFLIHLKSMHQISDIEGVHYKCNDCEESVMNYASFLNHVRCTHYEALKLCCDICNEVLPNYEELALHREGHIEILENLYPVVFHCFLCEKVHSTEKELKIHTQFDHGLICSKENEHANDSESLQNLSQDKNSTATSIQVKDEYHETEQTFQCGLCVKTFCNENDLESHLLTHPEVRPFKCEICSERFIQRTELMSHLFLHIEKRPFKCEFCGQSFKREEERKRHLLLHTVERPYKCKKCAKRFTQKLDLQTHMKTHGKRRVCQCDICFKAFKKISSLKTHLLIHAGEPPLKCEICSKIFVRKIDLMNHQISHKEERAFKCEVCEKCFKSEDEKQNHQISHNEERPFKCEVCEKCFKRKDEKQVHMRIHSSDRPNKCDTLPKGYQYQYNDYLERNRQIDEFAEERRHIKQRRYKCDICLKSFIYKYQLKKHLLIHTKESFKKELNICRCKGVLQVAETEVKTIESMPSI